MNAFINAIVLAIALERQQPAYRDPAHLTPRDVCPHCKRETEIYLVFCDGHTIETHRCRDHGDVVPMRSAIVNP